MKKPTAVRDARTGHTYYVEEIVAKADENLTILKQPAVDVNGRPLAPRPKTRTKPAAKTTTAPKE